MKTVRFSILEIPPRLQDAVNRCRLVMPDATFPKPTFGSNDLENWFETVRMDDAAGKYVNFRLRARDAARWQSIRPIITQYIEWAHAGPRRCFHDSLGISLDPRGGRPPVEYPGSLPLATRK